MSGISNPTLAELRAMTQRELELRVRNEAERIAAYLVVWLFANRKGNR